MVGVEDGSLVVDGGKFGRIEHLGVCKVKLERREEKMEQWAYLEYIGRNGKNVSGESRKFWWIFRRGSEVVRGWGRIGRKPQTQAETFATVGKAQDHFNAKVNSKVVKGYVINTEIVERFPQFFVD